MNNIRLIMLLILIYVVGFYSGLNIEKVGAIVQAPNENNNKVISQNNQSQPPANTKPMITQPQKPQGVSGQAVPTVVKNEDKRPLEVQASTEQGVTLYSISSAMRVDIERLEDDVASLKNKINILSNMR